MKIKVELEVDASEIELTHELIKTFKSITQHVEVARTGSVPPVLSANAPSPRLQAHEVPATAPAAASRVNEVKSAPLFTAWLGQYLQATTAFNDDVAQKSAQDEALRLILDSLPSELSEPADRDRLEDFLAAYKDALWVHGPEDATHVVPMCTILLQLSEPLKDEAVKRMVSAVMRHMTVRRDPKASRSEIFRQATTFAAMVQMQLIQLEGAVQTIVHLLKPEDKRGAAITMLGKTVELCCDMMLQQCASQSLSLLRSTLESIEDPEYAYDKDYIMQTMRWNQAPPSSHDSPAPERQDSAFEGHNGSRSEARAAAPSQAVSSAKLLRLEQKGNWGVFDAPVKGIAVDIAKGQVIAVASNGLLVLFDKNGNTLNRVTNDELSFSNVDYSPAHGLLAMTAQQKSSNPASSYYVTYQIEGGMLRFLGKKKSSQPNASLANIQFLRSSENFIAAEKMSNTIELVNAKSIASASSGVVTPLKIFQTKHTMMTFLTSVPTSPHAFLSADKTGVVYLWDAKQDEILATLNPPRTNGAPSSPNVGVITCLEVLKHLVLASAFDQGVNVWDLRQLKGSKELECVRTIKLDESTVTRIIRGPGETQAVIAAVDSIYTIQLDEDGQLIGKVAGDKQSKKFYYDAKWDGSLGRPALYAASAGCSVDVYHSC